jgi:flagellar motor protein MotB
MKRSKFPFALSALLLCGSLSANETAAPAAADPMSETIQENVKEKLTIQKVIPAIELNVKETVESGTARTDSVLAGQKPIPSEEDFQHYATLNSNQVLRPWNPLIPEPPLVTFYPGLSKVASKSWEFKVSDQAGDVIKTIKGKGVPPSSIEWNGLNEKGEFITVGTLYSYQFVTYDEHGNGHTFPGEPFQLDALLYKQKGKLFVEFSSEKLFDKDGAVIKAGMKGLWERAIDVVRENSDAPITVEVFSDSVQSPLAEERRRVAVTSISDSTNIPAVDIRHKVEKMNERGSILRLVMVKK